MVDFWLLKVKCVFFLTLDFLSSTAMPFIISMLLASLNSCCNPWIYMFFAGHLFHDLKQNLLCCSTLYLKSSQCRYDPEQDSVRATPPPTSSKVPAASGVSPRPLSHKPHVPRSRFFHIFESQTGKLKYKPTQDCKCHHQLCFRLGIIQNVIFIALLRFLISEDLEQQ